VFMLRSDDDDVDDVTIVDDGVAAAVDDVGTDAVDDDEVIDAIVSRSCILASLLACFLSFLCCLLCSAFFASISLTLSCLHDGAASD